ncbi:MAG: putative enamine/imine deaminase [Candidatus Desulfovibrio kirbyi]|jgi:2-iminobutanoate/2-iminopropanoate deaminase|uniref:Putative enamine/imine deaminase n=1 Tax=Candidatus Desulfovibrio kirbyi TaxID=2696086 RepID=A0A6L2R6U8_9BACT|nr:RidA family protein [Desulfovibrio sp.]GFH63172.1 MAG: putative enamine/imine deaminase [Candidatus Desulfovibrio kirbyi]
MSALSVIDTNRAPGAVGPYSQAIAVGGLIFTSGQLPMDPATKTMPEDIRAQAKNSLTNVKNILEAGGSDLAKVVKTTIFLADIKDFAAVNEVYATFFAKPFPARSCFAVKNLPLGAKVEIEAVAAV